MEPEKISFKEQRVRKITQLYYSRKDVQQGIYNFSKNREISPRYFEGFGKRPDTFQYPSDVFGLVKKGATSFHCSQELWEDPLKIVTGMDEKQLNELRTGWDLLIDIDSKYLDYSKISAEVIIKMLRFHGVKNIGVKFSGSKGFHILVPWKSFPKGIDGENLSDKFPEYPRIITKYLMDKIRGEVTKRINDLIYEGKEYSSVKKYIKREKGSQCINESKENLNYQISYLKDNEESYNKQVLPDLVLVSPRHLFRIPYSLHEKTALASVVVNPDKISEFKMEDADPMKAEIKSFMPEVKEGEASELLMQALDWYKENTPKGTSNKDEVGEKKIFEHKTIKLTNLSEANFPPCVKNILKGVKDGKKRAVFVLLNAFRSVGMDRDEIEQRLEEWNKKNEVPLKQGYIKAQLSWSYKRNPIMPSNCKEFYQGMAVCQPDDFCKLIKNPVNYIIRKNLQANKSQEKPQKKKTQK